MLEALIGEVDALLRTLLPPKPRITERLSPAADIPETPLSILEQNHVAGLMRVNHAGEVCAQALYRGQALTAYGSQVKHQLRQAAEEETDHLAWCEQRLEELKSKPSLLNPLWYGASLLIGVSAGLIGDRWSLGFIAETEKQVSEHLQNHLKKIPPQDGKTKAVLKQMERDERQHAEIAQQEGAESLPLFIQTIMRNMSKAMTHCSYYI